jgi:hypothetical protein
VDAAQIEAAKQRATHHGYFRRVLLGLDLFANVAFFRGKTGETVSAHAQRDADAGKLWGKAMTKFLHIFQRNHGKLAEIGDLGRAEQIVKTEQGALKDIP